MSYVELSYRFFGNFSRSLKPYFSDIKDDMQKANMSYTLEEYLSAAFFTVTLTFVVETIFMSFAFGFFIEPLLAVILGFMLALGVSGFLFFIFYSYPLATAKSRENKIKKVLPFALAYITTLSSSKAPPFVLFKTLGKFKEYGEVAKESQEIANSVEVFGLSISAAIRREAKMSPSKDFRDILWGINTIIASGGDLTGYLKSRNDELMEDYRRSIRKFSNDLSLYVEVYLTLIITGAIFFVVLSSIIASFSAGIETVVIQSFVVFIVLPLLSVMFIILIKSVSPLE